ncbi:MAG: metallophosphoesterase family protein [Verrucomicrobiota bacterium]
MSLFLVLTRFVFTALVALIVFGSHWVWSHEGHSNLRHWETASADPDRIVLTFAGDPATSRAVTWRTSAEVTNAVAEITVALGEPGMFDQATRVSAKTEPFDMNRYSPNKQGVVHYHSVQFSDLKPDTLYAYRVGDGQQRWSEWIQFRTAAAEPAPFRFLYFGDAQNNVLSTWSRVIRMASQTAPDARFAIHAGDLINMAHSDQEWAGWFKAGSFLHAQWATVAVLGNHEFMPLIKEEKPKRHVSILWRPQFTLPIVSELPEKLHETVYSVSYQGAQIIVLNSSQSIEAQTEYLRARLQEPGYQWRIVSYHHSIYSPRGRSNTETDLMRKYWVPLFHQYGVDLVLQGHDHAYTRGIKSAAIRDEVNTSPSPVVYVTSVSGQKQYEVQRDALERYQQEYQVTTDRIAENTQFFQVIDVESQRLTYRAYTATGELYDTIQIDKNQSDGTKTITAAPSATPERNFGNTTGKSYDLIKAMREAQKKEKP